MIRSVIFENEFSGRLEIDLRSPETSHGLWIKSIKGIGPGKADINVTDLASSDGGIFNSARSQKRNITFTIGVIETATASVEENRRYLYKWLGKKNPVTIIFVTDPNLKGGGGNPLSNLSTFGYVESNEPDIFNKQETIAISIICPDPNFYPYNSRESIGFSSIEDKFEFPFSETETKDTYHPTLDQKKIEDEQHPENNKKYYEYSSGSYSETQDNAEAFRQNVIERGDPPAGKTYFEKMTVDYWFSNEELEDPVVEPYFVTSDTERQSGKTYYEYLNNEYVETQDDPFIEGKTYYEKEVIPYWVTRDNEMKPGKEYYEQVSAGEYYLTSDLSFYYKTTDKTMQQGKTYYEISEGLYVVTSDESFVEDKTYYERQNKTYYEYNDRIVLANKLAISNLVIDYDGEIDIGLTFNIVISGDVSGLTIYKYDIDGYNYESFTFNDSAIPNGRLVAGDEIQVNTVTGNKYCYLIRNGHYDNILNALGKDPDWLCLNKGTNTFSYGADIGPEYVSVYISYTKAYEGV